MANNLRIAELDFDDIKTNLKTFMQAQNELSDYDFEGSTLSVLLDILAYNTHYNAYLANMNINEMFLDSAVKRESAVSIAKHLGYTPRSARSATAVVDITVNSPTGSPTTLTLDEYTQFSTTINGTAYRFVNKDAITITPINGVYTFPDVVLFEGEPLSFNYSVQQPGPAEKYEIPNNNVDTSTLKVIVQNSVGDSTSLVYTLATDITGLDGTSRVFYLQENTRGRYEIFFGDGILGKLLAAGNIVKLEYLISSGPDTNTSSTVLQNFILSGSVEGNTNVDVTSVSNSVGGADKENIDSIKFNAPLVNSAKNRAVTAADYKALVEANFSGAESVSVWGGEDNDPPIFGKVLISLKPFDGFVITDTVKEQIKNSILSNKKVLAIQPEFVDPDFLFVNIDAFVTYNPSLTTQSAAQIRSVVTQTVNNYFSSELQKFNKSFYHSQLIKNIIDSNTSINSAILLLKVQKRLEVLLNTTSEFTGDESIKFFSTLHPGDVMSSAFFVNVNGVQTLVRFIDVPATMPPTYDGTGNLRLVDVDTGAVISSTAGTVGYGTGIVTINQFTVSGFPAGINDIRVTAELQRESYNINSQRNLIILLDDSTENTAARIEAGLSVTTTAEITS